MSLPVYGTGEAAGFDLAASADVVIAPRSIALVPTGLVIGVPAGHFLAIFARSSTPLKRGLLVANGVGVVDPDYCGPADEVRIQLLNITDQPVQVARGDRLAQGIILPAPRVTWDEVSGIRDGSRGGFGSTGA
ncbi:MAG: dUTP diphosphatase [Vicinamibacterales bacterium]